PISGRFVFSRSLDEIQTVTNLSPSGAFIVTENPYGVGDYLACTLESNGQSVSVQGQVTRTSDSGVGIRFHSLSDEKAALLLLIVAEQQNRENVSKVSMLS
ncbi:MAG: PilZ domain-containing protein, partial [Cytophagaceae bacterium]